jgi:hypothetical protein
MHPVGLALLRVIQRRQAIAELHQQPRPLFPASRILKDLQRLSRFNRQAHRNISSA